MELLIFNKENAASSGRVGTASVRFDSKGVISVSKVLRATIGLKPGDGILIAQDKANDKDWYIKADKNGLELRLSNKAEPDGSLLTNSAVVAKNMAEALDADKGTMLVGKTPHADGWYPIFTASLK